MKKVVVKETSLQQATIEGKDAFLQVFVNAIYDVIGREFTVEAMSELNADQLTLLSWHILHEEVMDGGFVQLIHNGYGPFIFKNPVAKMFRQWGLRAPSDIIYKAHTLWLKYRKQIEIDCDQEEFMALFEQFPEFDELDDLFVEHEEEWTADIAYYVDEHLEHFATIEQ